MPFHTIQAAVNAASPGDHIQVAPGTYTEQVTIPVNLTNLTIQAQHPYNENNQPAQDASQLLANNLSFIQAPSTNNGAIVTDFASNFQIKGFVIEGPATSPGDPVQQGILVIGAQNVQIMQNAVVKIQEEAANAGDPTGTGIRVDAGGSATINNDYVAAYQKSGIVINDSTAQLNNDVVVGQGPISTIAQNGVEFDNGAQGSIQNSVVTGNIFAPQTVEDVGILLDDSGQVFVTNNLVYSNDGDILLFGPSRNFAVTEDVNAPNMNEGSVVSNNQTFGATYDGITLDNGVNSATVSNNQSQGNGDTGIFLFGSSFGNSVTNNQCTNDPDGILLWNGCTGNQIANNQCKNDIEGIFLLAGCSGNSLTNNNCMNNFDNGIVLDAGCNGNTLSNDQVNNNATNGVLLLGSSGNTLSNIQGNNNGVDGIALAAGSTGNQLTNDQFNNAGNDGIFFSSDSTGNTISNSQAHNSGHFDLEDQSVGGGTAGTGNTYIKDQFKTSNVPALTH